MSAAVPESPRTNVAAAAAGAGGRRPGVLVVDDTPLVLALVKTELEEDGFAVWPAEDGVAAVELFAEYHELIDLVLLDVQMPRLDGPKTLRALRLIRPDVRCCFMTGGSGTYSEDDLLRLGAVAVLGKPLRPAELAGFVRGLMARPPAGPGHQAPHFPAPAAKR